MYFSVPYACTDLNAKMEAMITILEGGTQDHVHHKWKEDLIEMLEELGQSYRVLFISYNQLKSKTSSNVVLIWTKESWIQQVWFIFKLYMLLSMVKH
uniref:Uncharacterized protein n=1 Tax=Lotus japonicus TaxID=34305 RepID=I3SYE3_LOTJA|nr:unknown [Lotus japonicus]